MRTKYTVLIAVLGCGLLVGVAQAGDRNVAAHWNSTAAVAQNEPSQLEGFNAQRSRGSEAPWRDMTASKVDVNDRSEFHRNRPMDPANPWTHGVIQPSLPTIGHSAVDQKLSL